MINLENQKLDDIEYRIKQLEALVWALIERVDETQNRRSNIKHEYQNKAQKLGINPDYPG